MMLDIKQIYSSAASEIVYRRRHLKPDGREVLLYGYAPPDQPALDDELEAPAASSELRWHPLRQEWAIYAAGRQDRTYKPSSTENPLAPSKPGAPPTEIPFADFEIAVFENRFPSLREHQNFNGSGPDGIQRQAANGRCEVIVYSPDNRGSLATLGDRRRQLLVHSWIDRYAAMFAMGCDTILPFENRGDEVGVTLHHPHGQIYGFPFTPPVQASSVKAFNDGFDLARGIKDWRRDYEIASAGGVCAFAPPFARFPFETWIAPFEPRRGPWEFSSEELQGFAALLGEITRRYDEHFQRPCPYMLSLHAAPQSAGDNYHFTAQFYPLLRAPDKLKYLASVEQATGVFTVDILPEKTALTLRSL
jgi:UDPglucose--hexose-1-phosphate uridylyltransferase